VTHRAQVTSVVFWGVFQKWGGHTGRPEPIPREGRDTQEAAITSSTRVPAQHRPSIWSVKRLAYYSYVQYILR